MVKDVGGLLAATPSVLCLFLEQNKDYRPEDGFPASIYVYLKGDYFRRIK